MIHMWTRFVVAGLAAGSLAGCARVGAVTGSARVGQPLYTGPVEVELAFTDSFDVLPGNKCGGRGLFAGVVDGAEVQIRRSGHPGDDPVMATASTVYERDTARIRGVYDDGQYCVAKLTFITPGPSLEGYEVQFPPIRNYSMGTSERVIPTDAGRSTFVIQSCTDYDAPPERACGYN
jgi:hypothetical protein